MARKRPRYEDEGDDFREELKNNHNGDAFDEDDDVDYGAQYDVDDDDDDDEDDADADDSPSEARGKGRAEPSDQESSGEEAEPRGRGKGRGARLPRGKGRPPRGRNLPKETPVSDASAGQAARDEREEAAPEPPGRPPVADTPPAQAARVPPEPEPQPEPEPEPESLEPDNEDAIHALRDLGARVDLDQQGRVWRIFLYEKSRDNTAAQIHGFPRLKEIWLLGSKVSAGMVERLREAYPKVKIYV